MKNISLPNKQFTIIDDDNFNDISKYSWRLVGAGYVSRGVRLKAKYGGKHKIFYLHREIMGAKKGEEVDHINHNKLDNRKSNLRICNHRQNHLNRKGDSMSSSGFKGVSFKGNNCKDRPWCTRIFTNKKEIYLGNYATPQEAAKVYNIAAKKYFGDYAFLNKIDA
jgi:hypothetical protein